MSLLGVEIVGAIGRRPERRELQISGVSTDSRVVQEGELFFALEGKRTDGHDYVVEALDKGAAAVVVHRDVEAPEHLRDRVVRVENTLRALGRFACLYRRRWGGKVIAVTGSNGKTTAREMMYHILSPYIPCKRSPRSFNTNIGVPLTLFQAERDDEVLIVEMGTNGPGEIRELVEIAEPDHGVITNVAESHLEGLGSEEGVACAKAELLDGLGTTGTAFLNADDAWFSFFAQRHKGPIRSFGIGPSAELRGRAIRRLDNGHWFTIPGGIEVRLRVPGIHNVRNALAALAVAQYLGVDLAAAAARLESFRPPPMRYQVEEIGGVTVVIDCYNANPGSMRAALEEFREMHADGRRIAVLGDMMELGKESEALHARLGAELVRFGADILWAVGTHGKCVAGAAERNGLAGAAFHAATLEDAAAGICETVQPGDLLLVKGSRGMAMEGLVEKLRSLTPAKV